MASHREQKVFAATKGLVLLFGEDAGLDEFLDPLFRVKVGRHPMKGVQIAQAPLAILDVGFDHIARRA